MPRETYTLFLTGVADADGNPVPLTSIRFTTRGFVAQGASSPVHRVARRAQGAATDSPATAAVSAAASQSNDVLSADKKKDKPSQDASDDEAEDWVPGQHNRGGNWRVRGVKGDPTLLRNPALTRDLTAGARRTAISGRPRRAAEWTTARGRAR